MKTGLISMFMGCTLAAGCGGSGSNPTPICSVPGLEAALDTGLTQAVTGVDFSFSVERQDGRRYKFSRGVSSLQTSYESASTSKLVTAVIILRLVERGYLNLSDRPQDRISTWPIASSDTLYNMTLAQLLGFTSGLTVEPLCLNFGISNFETCVTNIANANVGNGITPGQQFYYASTHLQVAGLMAVKARGVATWQDVFTEFKTQTGLFATAAYDLPSSSNPRLAGGMHWTKVDLPEPLTPVTTVNASSGNFIFRFLRLFSRAPVMVTESFHFLLMVGIEIFSLPLR